jgi:site-specific recombinase XerD
MITLQQLFVRVHARYTRSPFVEDLGGFARWLIGHEYPARYAQRLVFWTMRALEASGRPPGHRWTFPELEQAFRRRRQRHLYHYALRRFSEFLRSTARLASVRDSSPHASLLAGYQQHLEDVCGLATVTVTQHLAEVKSLLRHALPKGQPLKRLSARVIESHLERRARHLSRGTLHTSLGYLRCFLRYAFDQRLITTRLDGLEHPVCFRDEQPPRALDWSLIQRFLRSIERTSPHGWRDLVILHLMAHYGIRTGEITRLTLDAIDWSGRALLVEQYKTHSWLKLPLTEETLGLLRGYLRDGRRPTQRRELFLCARPPARPLHNSGVCSLFKRRARQSGLPLVHASPYALRHSFAMRLFARGVGIKAIGDLMGHNSLLSTAVYLRLQTDMLREVALPVPTDVDPLGGAS